MLDRNQKPPDPSNTDLVELTRGWMVKNAGVVADRIHIFVLLWPKTAIAIGLTCVLAVLAILRTGQAVGRYRETRHHEWRLQDIDARVRQADQRIRQQLQSLDQQESSEFRGVFETMRDPTDPPSTSEPKP